MNPSHDHAPKSRMLRISQEHVSAFISAANFPCVGAKSALNRDRITFAQYPSLASKTAAIDLCGKLEAFSAEHPNPGASPVSLVAMFDQVLPDEQSFETALWALLQAMHDHDCERFTWDSSVGMDPSQEDFSLSIAGRSFFVVGLHPAASRLARRSPFPCVVFNFHNQFESLKASGKYKAMQAAIRERDMRLQGSINPVLALYGEASEARQYAGRAVEAAWRCPFHTQEAAHAQPR